MQYDLIVIGAGAHGSATAYQAAKAGQRVLLLEQYAIDHQRGSSYGYSRIIRYAYDHPVYIELMKAAFPAWRALEQESGETIYIRTGGIDFAPPDEPSFRKVQDSLAQAGIAHEILSVAEAEARFPQWHFDDGTVVLYQEDAGALRASVAVKTHVRLAQAHGAEVRDNTPVLGVKPIADGVEVKTAHETFSAARVVVVSGAWIREMMLPLGVDLPLSRLAAQENYFTPLDVGMFLPERFPVWIGHLQAHYGNDTILYGLPSVDGSGPKAGLHGPRSGRQIDPESPERTPDKGIEDAVMAFARRTLPQAAGGLSLSRVCLYTYTPDEHFIIDRHPEYPQIIVASICSGHGFKFSALMGSILSDLALKGETAYDIEMFRLSRFAKIEV